MGSFVRNWWLRTGCFLLLGDLRSGTKGRVTLAQRIMPPL